MSTERPLITPPLRKTYAQQRKDRLQDAIDDYLQDGEFSAQQTYEEVLSCINDVIEYHQNAYCRARELHDLMTSERTQNLNKHTIATQQEPVYNEDGSTSYKYAAHITLSDINKFQRGNSL